MKLFLSTAIVIAAAWASGGCSSTPPRTVKLIEPQYSYLRDEPLVEPVSTTVVRDHALPAFPGERPAGSFIRMP